MMTWLQPKLLGHVLVKGVARDPPMEAQVRPLDPCEILQRIVQIQESLVKPNGNPNFSEDDALYHQRHQEAIEKLVSNAMKYTCKAAQYPNIFVTDCLESLNVCSGLHRMIVFT
jgi:hypothetical protein